MTNVLDWLDLLVDSSLTTDIRIDRSFTDDEFGRSFTDEEFTYRQIFHWRRIYLSTGLSLAMNFNDRSFTGDEFYRQIFHWRRTIHRSCTADGYTYRQVFHWRRILLITRFFWRRMYVSTDLSLTTKFSDRSFTDDGWPDELALQFQLELFLFLGSVGSYFDRAM